MNILGLLPRFFIITSYLTIKTHEMRLAVIVYFINLKNLGYGSLKFHR